MNEERFDQVIQELHDEQASTKQVEAAQDRVWNRLATSRSLACEDLHDDLAGYAAGTLGEARRLLAEDHVSRCVECRHQLAEIKGDRKIVAMPTSRRGRLSFWTRWSVAAGIVLAMLYIGRSQIDSLMAPAGARATVLTVSGTLYEPSGDALFVGAELSEGELVRTAAGARAVLQLRDGSRVEMNERTELSIRAALTGDTVRLDRGDIIVEAADQGVRRLRVVTRDSIAEVKGTVFAVSSGTAGSLVSVVEGSVEVAQTGFDELLLPGQQAASTAALGEIGMREAISWSQGADDYYALLSELAKIEESLAGLTGPAMRREARLVNYLPDNVGAYFAIPNLEGTIGEALTLLNQRAGRNPVIADWWLSEDGRSMRSVLETMGGVTALFGEEMVFVLTGMDPIPLFIAEIRPGGEAELERLIAEAQLEAGADLPESLPYQIIDGVMLASDNGANLALLVAQLGAGATTPFADEIRDYYGRGVGWLAAIDITVFGQELVENELSRTLGLHNMSYLFLEQRSGATGDATEVTLSFSGDRVGMASWLAAPGGIGSTEYISASVLAASSGSTRDPQEAFDQLLSALGPASKIAAEINKLESETGIDLRDDVAASLGTDFVIAIERISFPSPAWVAVFEVVNPGALDAAVQRMVDTINRQPSTPEGGYVALTEETVNGRTWKVLTEASSPVALTWTFDRGYMVASTDRAAALRAIAVRDSSSSLIRSAAFQQQFPAGTDIHNSGFFWLNTNLLADAVAALGQGGAMAALMENRDPVLIVVTGEDRRVRWSSRTRLTSLILDLMMAQPIG